MGAVGSSSIAKNDAVDDTPVAVHVGRVEVTAMRAWAEASGAEVYVQYFDVAVVGDISLGTTTADWVIHIPAADDVSAGDGLPTDGFLFENGVFVAATTTPDGSSVAAVTPNVRTALR